MKSVYYVGMISLLGFVILLLLIGLLQYSGILIPDWIIITLGCMIWISSIIIVGYTAYETFKK